MTEIVNPIDRALPPLGYTSSPDGSSQVSRMTHSKGQEQSALARERETRHERPRETR
jgi:hypothetical protein